MPRPSTARPAGADATSRYAWVDRLHAHYRDAGAALGGAVERQVVWGPCRLGNVGVCPCEGRKEVNEDTRHGLQLLRISCVAKRFGFEVALRWVPREMLGDADALSKMVDRMDLGLAPEALEHVLEIFGPVNLDRFAAPKQQMSVPQRDLHSHQRQGRLADKL